MAPVVSVLVNTYQRPKKIQDCLNAILKSSFSQLEIIVIEQRGSSQLREFIKKIDKTKIRYFNLKKIGASKAKNFGIKKSKGEILAFTDDDCIIDRYWLKNIYESFKKNQNIIGIFGKVLPYQPHLHRGKICPCTFLSNKKKTINRICFHWKNIGFGNNMAFRKEIFEKMDGFKEWLGPGSIGSNAEDAEFALRLLSKGYKILYNPEIKVYHNRWLTKEEFRKQCLSYSCGEVACYGFLAFKGNKLGKKVIKNNFLDSWGKLKFSLKSILFFKKRGFRLFYYTLQEFYFRLRGLLVSFWFAKVARASK